MNEKPQYNYQLHATDDDTQSIVIFTTEDNVVSLDVKLENDTVWLSQSQMATLFDKDRTTISRHINNVFKEGELDKSWYVQKLHTPRNMVVEKDSFKHLLPNITTLM